MGNDNVRVACIGFESSPESKENILIVFRSLLDLVPYDSFLEITLTKIPTGFQGRIEVSSLAGEFTSVQNDFAPQELVEKLAKDLRLQLVEWKSKRFSTNLENVHA